MVYELSLDSYFEQGKKSSVLAEGLKLLLSFFDS
jgi:hypothetical protein